MHSKYLFMVFFCVGMILNFAANAMSEVMVETQNPDTKKFTLCVHDLTEGIKSENGKITLCSDPKILTQEYMVKCYPFFSYVNKEELNNIQQLDMIGWRVGISMTPEKLSRGAIPMYGISPVSDEGNECESYDIKFEHQEAIEDYYLTLSLLGKLEITRQAGTETYKKSYCCVPIFQSSTKVNLELLENYDLALTAIDSFAVSHEGKVKLKWNVEFLSQFSDHMVDE